MEDRRAKFSLSEGILKPNVHFRLLGFVPLAFFMTQAIHYWKINELGHMLWMCNIGNLLLAIGLFLEHKLLIRVATIWMIPGFVVWVVYVVAAWGMFFSSTLAHAGGLTIGLIAVKRARMDSAAWRYAFGWYLVIQILSRFATPNELNVNVSQQVQPGWETAFGSYWQFWSVLTIGVAVSLWMVGLVLRRLYPEPSQR